MKLFLLPLIFLFGVPPIYADPLRVLFLGDSVTIGYGLKVDEAYPKLVEEILKKEGLEIQSINGGVSGDTTAGGLRRLEWMLRTKPDVVVVALGANDMLRGLPVEETHKNLGLIMDLLKQKKMPGILFGMRALPNYGPRYERDFNKMFDQVAKESSVPYKKFFISTVAGNSKLNLSDGIHPNREGQKVLAADLVNFLRPQLMKIKR